MKNKITSILVKTKDFLTEEQNKLLRIVLEEELLNDEIIQQSHKKHIA